MMQIQYKSTRGAGKTVNASQAILKGLADDGGLFVPDSFPKIDKNLTELSRMNYKEIVFEVLKKFFTDFTEEELLFCINSAYDEKFDTEEFAPVIEKDGKYFMELFHGPTIAFKDMALSILPYLMITASKKNNNKNDIVILTATSGDTGKAALAGFADVVHTKIIVFYPKGGVSRIQELQMVTEQGKNTCVIGVNGNFDDCQSEVKRLFNDPALRELSGKSNYRFSSANSINIGRLFPQTAYYVWAYSRLVNAGAVKAGEKINFVVPTGNFGNILAGYYAKQMGLPINKFICASNDNKVLFDFFKTGTYDKNRPFYLTSSPSMDILISSNLERFVYYLAGEDEGKICGLMSELKEKGKYSISSDEMLKAEDFVPGFATEDECAEGIKKLYDKSGYVIDTHTGVANSVYDRYKKETGDNTPSVIVSTASPYKFARAVIRAIKPEFDFENDFDFIDELRSVSDTCEPEAIRKIRNAEIIHKKTCEISEMESEVKNFLGI